MQGPLTSPLAGVITYWNIRHWNHHLGQQIKGPWDNQMSACKFKHISLFFDKATVDGRTIIEIVGINDAGSRPKTIYKLYRNLPQRLCRSPCRIQPLALKRFPLHVHVANALSAKTESRFWLAQFSGEMDGIPSVWGQKIHWCHQINQTFQTPKITSHDILKEINSMIS